MKILSTPVYPYPMNLEEILEHSVKKIMFTRPDHTSIMCPHQYIGIIASNNTLRPYDICYFIKQSFFMDPGWKFNAHGKTAAQLHVAKCYLTLEFVVVVKN